MKTTTLIFNAAAVVACVGVFIALVDLMRHKANTFASTSPPSTQAPVLPTVPPQTLSPGP